MATNSNNGLPSPGCGRGNEGEVVFFHALQISHCAVFQRGLFEMTEKGEKEQRYYVTHTHRHSGLDPESPVNGNKPKQWASLSWVQERERGRGR